MNGVKNVSVSIKNHVSAKGSVLIMIAYLHLLRISFAFNLIYKPIQAFIKLFFPSKLFQVHRLERIIGSKKDPPAFDKNSFVNNLRLCWKLQCKTIQLIVNYCSFSLIISMWLDLCPLIKCERWFFKCNCEWQGHCFIINYTHLPMLITPLTN